jgi:hypothetical protein
MIQQICPQRNENIEVNSSHGGGNCSAIEFSLQAGTGTENDFHRHFHNWASQRRIAPGLKMRGFA